MSDMKFDPEQMKRDMQGSMDQLNGVDRDSEGYPPGSAGPSDGDDQLYPPGSAGPSDGDDQLYPPASAGPSDGDDTDDYPDVDESYPVGP
ncbi:hypothetical protein ACPW96_21915 [Micromonospora sp. DT81.3]|uniref:hypothetical protein n=1 Tax=Micromonospora sp. DT81.3 TaxID=3416523 RepID=UPI003CEED2C1